MLYHIEAAELAERAHFEGVDEGDRVGMAELYSKSRVQAGMPPHWPSGGAGRPTEGRVLRRC